MDKTMTADLDDIDFECLIGDRDIDIYKLVNEISKYGIAWVLYFYARFIIEGRWPEAEPYIKKDLYWAYHYAKNIIKGRWGEAEPYIKKDPGSAYYYAIHIIKERWPEAEPHIKKCPHWTCCYSDYFGVKL